MYETSIFSCSVVQSPWLGNECVPNSFILLAWLMLGVVFGRAVGVKGTRGAMVAPDQLTLPQAVADCTTAFPPPPSWIFRSSYGPGVWREGMLL